MHLTASSSGGISKGGIADLTGILLKVGLMDECDCSLRSKSMSRFKELMGMQIKV